MKLIKGAYEDDLFFDIGWEMDIPPRSLRDNFTILKNYLSDPISQSKLNSTDTKGKSTVINLHGPFFSIPTPNDYNLISLNDFIEIIEKAIAKLAEPDDTKETVVERNEFKQAIIESVVNNEVMTTSDIFFLKWSYRYDTAKQFNDLFQYYYYVEFIFINRLQNKIYRAILGAD